MFKELYKLNLDYVLKLIFNELVPKLREHNYVIYLTADHGEILSKWRPNPFKLKWFLGFCKFVGHTRNFKELHLVPWVRL